MIPEDASIEALSTQNVVLSSSSKEFSDKILSQIVDPTAKAWKDQVTS